MGQFIKVNDRPELDLKYLEQRVVFIVHLSMAYPLIKTFLEGFYLMMNYWRYRRDKNGCKISKRSYDYFLKYL